ncbi:MAG: RDD family protein [Proteobacteria bacterium]|jgi:uncharacterized RDD family membrane protein YckC|nr:RDD family protein [Pseudomonadota bacterium]
MIDPTAPSHPDTIASDPPPRGFASRAGKRAVLRAVLIVGGALVAIQIVLPLVSMVAMLRTVFDGFGQTVRVDPERGALWRGSLWLVETTETLSLGRSSLDAPPEVRSRLLEWSPKAKGEPELAPLHDVDDARLVAAGDALWAIGRTRFVKMTRAGIEQKAIATELETRFSALYSDRGGPAAIGTMGDAVLDVYSLGEDGAWRPASEGGAASVVGAWTNSDVVGKVVVLPPPDGDPGGSLVVGLCPDGIAVERLAGFAAIPCADWTPVGARGAAITAWTAARVAGRVAVFTAQVDGLDFLVEGFAADDRGAWSRFFETRAGMVSSLAAFDLGDGRRFLLAIEGMPGSVTVHEIAGAEIAGTTKLTTSAEAEKMRKVNALSWGSNLAAVLTPFALLLALAGLLRRHRIAEYAFGGRAASFAPLWRRCLAGGIDVLLAYGPLTAVLVGAFVLSDMQEEGAVGMLRWMGWIGLASLWSVLWLFALAYTEGRFGSSPGKRLTGLRVLGVDLAPCGFGRALLRNVIELVDAVFGYAVGIALVALTPNQQRLGDLAARTIVVFSPRGRD